MAWYDSLLNSSQPSGEEQLRQARSREEDYSKYDKEAKLHGFKNGAEYYYFLKRQNQNNRVPEKSKDLSTQVMESDAMAWHPKVILQNIADIFKGINTQ